MKKLSLCLLFVSCLYGGLSAQQVSPEQLKPVKKETVKPKAKKGVTAKKKAVKPVKSTSIYKSQPSK